MISTAIALQNVTKEAVHDEMVMDLARGIFHTKDSMSEDEFAHALYVYSGTLAALTTTLVTSVLLTGEQLDDMIETIREMEQMGKDVE